MEGNTVFSKDYRFFFAILTILTANACWAGETVPLLPKMKTPQSIQRTHYVDLPSINPPIPIPVLAPMVSAETVPNVAQPQEITINTSSDSPTAWTFDEAITATLTADPVLHIGKTEIIQAKAELLASSQIPNPTLAIEGGSIPFKREGAKMESDFTVQMGMPLDWFVFAKRAAEINSARWGVQQTQAEYADLVRLRITETATAFYDVLEAKALLSISRQDLAILTRVEAVTQRAVEVGGIPSVELDRIRLELFKHRQELLEMEAELNIAKAKLWALLGRTDRDPNFDIQGSLDAPLTAKPYPIEEAFDLARQNRPDIRALRIQVHKAQADREVERRNAFPEVALSGGYVKEYLEGGRESGWGIGLSMSVPLFDRNQGGRARAQAALSQSNYELQAGVLELRAEVEEADQHFRTAHQKAANFAQEGVRLAIQVRNSIMQSYEVGGSPLIDVLDAERTYRETYRTYISSRADYWRAMYVYNSVVGL